MIDELHVRDVALIRDAVLNPSPTLTVVTGETGAGKTALLSALKLLSGERADSSAVRDGASGLLVEGRLFDMSSDTGADAEGVVAQRSVSCEGRSRVRIDGAMAGVGELAARVGSSIDLCGQHEHQRLLKPANHRALVDLWGRAEIADIQKSYEEAYADAGRAAREVEAVREAGQLGSEAVEQARFTLRRIDEVDPQPGEYDRLLEEVPKAENAEALAHAVEGAHYALTCDGGALDALGNAASLLESVASFDASLGSLAQGLRESTYVVEDVARDVRSAADDIEVDPAALEVLQDRLGELQSLMRTWGPTIEDVQAVRQDAAQTILSVEQFDERLEVAQRKQQEAEVRLADAARALHDARMRTAPAFVDAVCAQMARLELGGAVLECAIDMLDRLQWTADGPDKVEFLFRPGSNMVARPLSKIASGGEVSRVMLAIKVVLGSLDEVDTLVFDEVDAGVGGSTARALADVIADLAKTHQVIVVTHLAQVAVMGDVHYVVSKSTGDEPETSIGLVEGDARVTEIARMLSGDATQESLDHARRMIIDSASSKAAS